MYYMGFSYKESYWMPIWQRIWFLQRLMQEIKKATEDTGSPPPTHAYHQNTPEMRSLMGRMRPAPPAKLRRFT